LAVSDVLRAAGAFIATAVGVGVADSGSKAPMIVHANNTATKPRMAKATLPIFPDFFQLVMYQRQMPRTAERTFLIFSLQSDEHKPAWDAYSGYPP
jgi:IMP dehydrogenase/GMP reductase